MPWSSPGMRTEVSSGSPLGRNHLIDSSVGSMSASSRHTASTRMPMRTWSAGTSWMRCMIERSAPSRRIRALT